MGVMGIMGIIGIMGARRKEKGERRKEKGGNLRSLENVAIKREQRLLADYAEQKQQKDCEAGLI